MPTYATSQEWLHQSSLLLQARPTTTRITTKYSIKPVKLRPAKQAAADDATPKPPRGSLVIKTYDPISGVVLKYRTTKAAEVSRLIHSLGRLGRSMAALPELGEEAVLDAPAEGAAGNTGAREDSTAAGSSVPPAAQEKPSGGGKKKKKGKR